MPWQLQVAKARLSELVKRAETEGPQEITVHGQARAVVLSYRDYERLAGLVTPRQNLVEFMQASPLRGVDIAFERDRMPARGTPFDFDDSTGTVQDDRTKL